LTSTSHWRVLSIEITTDPTDQSLELFKGKDEASHNAPCPAELDIAEPFNPELFSTDLDIAEPFNPELSAELDITEPFDPELFTTDLDIAELFKPELSADLDIAELFKPELSANLDIQEPFDPWLTDLWIPDSFDPWLTDLSIPDSFEATLFMADPELELDMSDIEPMGAKLSRPDKEQFEADIFKVEPELFDLMEKFFKNTLGSQELF